MFGYCTKSKKTFKFNTKISDSISYYFSKLENDKISDEEKFKLNDKALNLIYVSPNTLKNREFTYNIITNYYFLESWYNYKKATKLIKNQQNFIEHFIVSF